MKESAVDRIRRAIAELRHAEQAFLNAHALETVDAKSAKSAKQRARTHLFQAIEILQLRGSLHWNWRHSDVSNATLHERVEILRGKPKVCEVCGLADPRKRYEWANLTGHYDDPADFKRMCVPCHHEYDGILGVRNRKKTHCPQGHEYNLENTIWVKGRRHRMCKVCNREKLRILRRDKPDTMREYARLFRERHHEELKERKRQAYHEHKSRARV